MSSPRHGTPAGAPAWLRREAHLRHTHGHAHAPALGRGRPLVLGSSPRRPSVAARSLWVLGEWGCLAGSEQRGVGAHPRLLGTAAPSGRDHPSPYPPTELMRMALAKGKAGMGAVAWEAARHKRPHHAGECSVWPGAPARSGECKSSCLGTPGISRERQGKPRAGGGTAGALATCHSGAGTPHHPSQGLGGDWECQCYPSAALSSFQNKLFFLRGGSGVPGLALQSLAQGSRGGQRGKQQGHVEPTHPLAPWGGSGKLQ